MKNECDIVKDLLFSYNDGVLSETSKEFVEEHLKKCKSCTNTLKEIKEEEKKQNKVEDIDFFKKIKKKLNKKNIIIFVSLAILFIFIVFNILVYQNYKEIASTMEIYLENDITSEELESLKNKIIEISDNIELEYVSKDDALEKMKATFADKQYLLDGYNSQNNPLRAYFSIKTSSDVQTIVDTISNMPGIFRITTNINNNPYLLFFYKIFNN